MAHSLPNTFPRPARIWLLLALLNQGCAQQPWLDATLKADETACLRWYQKLDSLTAEYEREDPGSAKIPGFPFLRTDRFLASFTRETLTGERYAAWLERLRQRDAEARRSEFSNLPRTAANAVLAASPVRAAFDRVIQQCGRRLVRSILDRPELKPILLPRTQVPDTYRRWQRIIGAYWLTQFPAKLALKNLHEKLAASFRQNRRELPAEGRLVRYAPASGGFLTAAETATLMHAAYQNPLGIPELSEADLSRIFKHYAPAWEIDTRNDTDEIGEVYLNDRGQPRLNTGQPIVYQTHAYTRWQGRILLQLIYQIWLPAREKTGLTDLFGGELDSVIWRVTLNPEGVPIAYDSIHACGCYYLLLPAQGYRSIAPKDGAEAVLSPKRIVDFEPGKRLLLRLQARTHYLQQTEWILETELMPAKSYQIAAYDALLALPLPDGSRRSLFGTDGIIAASARAERFLLWPFGVPSPGAMRQWGVHATSFTGRRYFDDPYLLEHLLADGS
ncbi:MAG: hypothetical protein ACU83V_10745 [Gammaproteobacteria bacterium]